METKYGVILGSPRSGTTFLVNSLKALPYCECVSGILLPVVIPHIVNTVPSETISQTLAFGFEKALHDYLVSGIPTSRFLAIQKWLLGYIDLKELVLAWQRKRVIETILYKEPFLSFAPEFTFSSLPDCKILYIYRDGRDCADSLVRSYDILTDEKLLNLKSSEMPIGRKYDHRYVPWWVDNGEEEKFLSSTPYLRAIWMWKEMVSRCHKFFYSPSIIASQRVMFLKYEDFIQEPLKYGEQVVHHFQGVMNNNLRKQFLQARTSSIGIHVKRDGREIREAEQLAKKELELYGYI